MPDTSPTPPGPTPPGPTPPGPTPPSVTPSGDDDLSWWQPDAAERADYEAAIAEALADEDDEGVPHDVVVREILEPMLARLEAAEKARREAENRGA